jgi:hypothetical protein
MGKRPSVHVGFLISAKNKNLVYDHSMNISAKFDSNLFCGFRKKDENVKFPSGVCRSEIQDVHHDST